MNRLTTLFTVLLLLSFSYTQAQTFPRTAEIKDPAGLERGFGAVVAGVDFDGDGLPEIYAVNTNMVDEAYELTPRIYKFEWNTVTSTWDSVWGAVAPVELQNTWPALAYGDIDKDNKMELYWAPVNNIGTDLNPARILVYEYPGTGEGMGVDDGFGGFEPNAKTSIVTTPSFNLRIVRIIISDVDEDGTDEIIFADRASSTSDWHVGILSIDDIPDNGGGLETWTTEFSGVGDINLGGTGNNWDLVVVPPYIAVIAGDGRACLLKYNAGSGWETFTPQSGIAGGNNTFKGMSYVDFPDGSGAVILGSWFSNKVYLIDKPDNVDTLASYEIGSFAPYAARLNGSGSGDLDGDALPDVVFGSRYDATNTARVPIFRIEYQSGDPKLASSWVTSIIDSGYWENNGDMDMVVVANVDGDAADEVLYSQGYSRGNAFDTPMPIVVLNLVSTPVSVEKETDVVPSQFFVDQNFPNPFNPSTQIRFGITEAANIDLRIYDALGREVAVLISNEFMSAGSYNVKFDASNLASGTYVYRMTAGANTVSRKMQLLK